MGIDLLGKAIGPGQQQFSLDAGHGDATAHCEAVGQIWFCDF